MDADREDSCYRMVIDELVRSCREGQGQIGPQRARAGIWNRNASADEFPDQHAANKLLAAMSTSEREVLARLLEGAFVGGMHEALVVLHGASVVPFDRAHEGTPFHDFVGRLNDWAWPTSRRQ